MEKAQGIVKSVEAKQVVARGEQTLVYEVQIDGAPGPLSTWKKETADTAMGLLNKNADYGWSAKPAKDPKYPPRYTLVFIQEPVHNTAPNPEIVTKSVLPPPEIPVVSNGNGKSEVSADQKYRGRLSNMNGVLQYAADVGLDPEAMFELFEQVQNVVDGASASKKPAW